MHTLSKIIRSSLEPLAMQTICYGIPTVPGSTARCGFPMLNALGPQGVFEQFQRYSFHIGPFVIDLSDANMSIDYAKRATLVEEVRIGRDVQPK